MMDENGDMLDQGFNSDDYSSDEESAGSENGDDQDQNSDRGEDEQMEKIQRKKYTPYKFNGKSYYLDI